MPIGVHNGQKLQRFFFHFNNIFLVSYSLAFLSH
nr:MAG TPA: hypothetical protein [Caudoviricetes sp.]